MKQKKITREEIPSMEEKDRMKYEIAEELGLLDQVLEGRMEIFAFKGNRAYRWSDDQETPEICGRPCLSQSVKGKKRGFVFV